MVISFLLTANEEFKEPDCVSSTEGLPNNLVNGCVCAISGEFVQSIEEFAIVGPEMLVQTINYGSHSNWKWSLVNHETITPFKGTYDGRPTNVFGLRQTSGAYLLYYSSENEEKEFKKTDLLRMKFMIPKGLTHGGTLHSGKTNLRRQKVTYNKEKKEVVLDHPSGDVTLFRQGYDVNDELFFFVKEILKVNGSKFEHLSKGNGEYSLVCKNKKTGKHYSHINTRFSKENGETHNHYKTSDGRTVDHFYTHYSYTTPSPISIPGKGLMEGEKKIIIDTLRKISGSSFPEIKFDYEPKAVGKLRQMIAKRLPDHRFIEIDYYKNGTNHLGRKLGNVNITKDDDYRLDKVKRLKAPVGDTAEPITTHTFVYDQEMEKNKKG